jgi:propanol-preferring alcohol dehydrogenase
MAVQYAKAMGFHVIAVDVADDKLDLAANVGADLTINATTQDAATEVQSAVGGAQGVLVTAASRNAFEQAYKMRRKRGTMSLVGLPPGSIELPIFDMVLNAKTVRGSIVGTRKDLEESLSFAGDGKVQSHFSTNRLENINQVLDAMKAGQIEGRVILQM